MMMVMVQKRTRNRPTRQITRASDRTRCLVSSSFLAPATTVLLPVATSWTNRNDGSRRFSSNLAAFPHQGSRHGTLWHEAIQYLQAIYNPEIHGSRCITRGACRKGRGPAYNTDTGPCDTTLSWECGPRRCVRARVRNTVADRAHRASHHPRGRRRDAHPVRSGAPGHLRVRRFCRQARAYMRARVAYRCRAAERRLWERHGIDEGRRVRTSEDDHGGACVVRVRWRSARARARCWCGACRPHAKSYRCDRAEIVASDIHPLALGILRPNIENNNFCSDFHGLPLVSAHFPDWQEAADPANALEAPFDVPFDEVFGADVVHELEHAAWISACLRRLVRLAGRFHLVIPIRGSHASRQRSSVFSLVWKTCTRWNLHCVSTQKESITCEAGPDSATGSRGDVEYAHYTILWTGW
ncbi:hypothetical protein EDB92DRAFT_283308 [Lactarius akahatsu]|uniref:Uncharacterized protein n=1 Tax=Lactarius akahatsu TaxID=416441 RepID=A0AAD4LKP1_9AGAM|nr:hypothetical protein EDB92DRAFT_283308 [Lactarius akahatsu]